MACAAKEQCVLSLVVPVYNEENSIALFLQRVRAAFAQEHAVTVEYIFVNDGSTDNTLATLLQHQDTHIHIIDLSRNFGKEAALTAGLHKAQGNVVVPIDVDLQDPPELILTMLAKWREGYEVVLARRADRDTDSWAKRVSANCFYKVHNALADVKIPPNVGDFRLMDRCVVDALKTLPESCRFMKGIFAWAGFHTTCVEYTRQERAAGVSKYNGWKLWNFALEGITSFSTVPLRMWTYVGLVVSCIAFILMLRIVINVLATGIDVPGYASLIVAVTFLGGLQLLGIGIIGEYLGRNYTEAKRRPNYIIRRVYDNQDASSCHE